MNDQPTDVFEPQVYRAMFERAGVGMALLDHDGRFVAVNPAACELLGYTRAELLGGPALADLVHPDDWAANAARLTQLLRGELNPLRLEQRFIGKDGRIIWAATFATQLSSPRVEGSEGGLLVELHDITARKQAEAELAAERDLFNALLEAIPDLVYFKDRESRFIRNSRSHVRFVGLDDPAQMVGKTDFDVFAPEHAAAAYADEQRVIATGEPLIGRLELIRRADGQFRWVTATKAPLRDREGRIIGTMGVTRDVDEQVRLQQELERQRRMLQAVLDTLPEFISFKDRDLAHVLCNKAVLEVHGRSMAEMYGLTDFDLYPAEEAARYAEEERRAMLTGEPVVSTRPVPTPSRLLWEECIKMPLRDESGQVVGVLSVGRDVTAQREQEKRLRLTQFAFDHAVASLFWATPDGRFVEVNQAVCRSLGYSREELLGMHIWDIDPNPEHSAATRAARWQMLKQQGSLHFETTHKTRDGRIIPVEIVNQYLRYEDEEYEFAFVVDITARKQAEAALQAERNLLRTLIDALPDHVYVKDRDGRYLLANRAQGEANVAITDFGYGVGHTDLEMLPEHLAQEYRQNDLRVLETGAPLHVEEPMILADGSQRVGWTVKVPLRDEQGQVIGLVGLTHDITARKQAEAALAAERNLLRTLLDTLPDFVYVKDLDGRFLLANRVMAEGLGFARPEDMVGLVSYDLYSPHFSDAYREHDRQVIESGQAVEREVAIPYASGQVRTHLVIKTPLRDLDGRIIGVVGANRDITARKQAEAALAAERNLLRTLIDALPDHVYVKDREGRLLLTNIAQARNLGFADPAQAVGKTDFDLFPAATAELIRANDQLVLQTGMPLSAEEEFVNPQGKSRWVWSVKAPLCDDEGRVIGLVGLSRDITEKRRLEEQLRQSQKMEAIGTLAGGVAHDFNNLLTSLIGYADFLLGSLDPLSPQYDDALTIKRVATRAADLTRQLLAFSRRQILRPQVLNLNTVVTGLLKMLKRVVGEDIELVADLAAELGNVKADPGQLEQVLMNLIVNAREAMPHGGRLVIATANATLTEQDAERYVEVMPGPYVRLTVSDTGVGMDAETLSRIFDPFFTTKEQGTGLGLATVYGIVKQSSGHVAVESEPGRGATFHVYLPRVEEAVSVAAEGVERPVGGAETVLVVEDDEGVRDMLRRALERQGYTVREAAHAAEAVRMCEAESPPDLVITDLVMPGGMNGRQLAERLREMHPGLKVMYISGYTDLAAIGREFLESGAVFLQKPFSFADLGRQVRRALEG